MASRSTKYFPATTGKIGLDGDLIGALEKFEKAIYETVLRSAAYAGAEMMYKEVQMRVPVRTGKLKESLFVYFDRKLDQPTFKSYLVGPNKRKAPHWYNVEYGHFRYNRSNGQGGWMRSKSNPNARGPGAHDLAGALPVPIWVPAKPYMRSAYDAKIAACLNRMKERLGERIKELTV